MPPFEQDLKRPRKESGDIVEIPKMKKSKRMKPDVGPPTLHKIVRTKRSKISKNSLRFLDPEVVHQCVNAKNSDIVMALFEISQLYFKLKNPRKGAIFAKAALSVHESPTQIKNRNDAIELKGIGKHISDCIEELFQTGTIKRLEELRREVS